MSIWDSWNKTIPSFVNPTKPATPQAPSSQPTPDPFNLAGTHDERPWWQRLGEMQTPTSAASSAPTSATSAPTSEPASAPTSEPASAPAGQPATLPATTPNEPSKAADEPAAASPEERKQRAADKARQMMTRSFAHTEDFDDFLFGTPPEELAVIRAEYDQMVAAAKSADPNSALTPFGTRFSDFTKDDKRWSRMATVDQEKISESVTAIFNASDGIGTDEDTIIKHLRGKSPDELKEIERVFAATYPGANLQSFLDAEMDGDYMTETKALIDGDVVTAASIGLQNAMFGAGTDEAKIEEILRGIPADKRADVFAQFKAANLGESFEDALDWEMDGTAFKGLEALSKGDFATGDAHLIDYELNGGIFGWTGDAEKKRVESLLEKSSDPAALVSAYSAVAGETLAAGMDDEFDGGDLDVMTSLMDSTSSKEDKKAKIATARIMRGLGGKLDKSAVLEELTKTTGADRDRLIAELDRNEDYRALVAGALTQPKDQQDDLAKFVVAFDDLQAPNADEDTGVFTAALQGEVDEGSIKAAKNALAGMTKETIDAHPELVAKLREAVDGSGRDEFEVNQLLLGKPAGDPAAVMAELHRREQEAYKWERGDGSWFVDTFSDAGTYLDERHARSEDRFETLVADGVTEADAAEFDRELAYTNAARASYGTRKDEIADGASTVVGAAALAAGTLATGGLLALVAPYLGTVGTAALANAAVISNMGGALIGGGASMLTKYAVKDEAYGSDEAKKDGAMTLVNMGAAGISQAKWLDKMVSGNVAAKGAITGLAAGLGQGAVNSVDTGEVDAGAILLSTAGQVAGGAIGNVVGGKLEGAMLPNQNTASIAKLLGVKSLAGAGGGFAGGTAQGAMDPGSYDGDFGKFLSKAGLSAVGGAFGNVAQGLAEGFGEYGKLRNGGLYTEAELAKVLANKPTPGTPDAPLTEAEIAGILWPEGMDPWFHPTNGNAD